MSPVCVEQGDTFFAILKKAIPRTSHDRARLA